MKNNYIEAEKWIKRAVSNYKKAIICKNDNEIYLEDICFDLQQAAEKAIKSVMIYYNLEIPKTHSIGFLLHQLQKNGIETPQKINNAAILTGYAVETRYPGEYEEIDEEEYKEAFKITLEVIQFCENILNQHKTIF